MRLAIPSSCKPSIPFNLPPAGINSLRNVMGDELLLNFGAKFPQFDWLRAVVFQLNLKIPTCENYKPFADSSIN